MSLSPSASSRRDVLGRIATVAVLVATAMVVQLGPPLAQPAAATTAVGSVGDATARSASRADASGASRPVGLDGGGADHVPVAAGLGSSQPSTTGALPHGSWPLAPPHRVVHGFDPPSTRWGAGHRGVDLAGATGAVVRAGLGGEVTFAGELAGRGVVVLAHGSLRTTYEPVAATVTVGDDVPTGAVIGRLELVGSHCFPAACLHWGLLRNQTYLDPLTLLGGPVRLLPMGGRFSAPPG